MHDHNTDLIMALAEGTLPPEQISAAEAEIAACATCSEDLALQRLALEALGAAPPVALTDIERARLHRSVREEVGPVAARASAQPRRGDGRRFRLLVGLAGAAAVLVGFVAVAPSLVGGGDDAGSDEPIAIGADTTAAAATTGAPSVAEDDIGRFQTAPGDATNEPAAGDGAESMAPTTAAPANKAATDLGGTDALTYTVWLSEDIEDLPDLTTLADQIQTEKSLEAVVGPQDAQAASRIDDLNEDVCLTVGLDAAPGSTGAFILGISGINDVEVVIIAYVTGDFETVAVVAHELESCRILASSQ